MVEAKPVTVRSWHYILLLAIILSSLIFKIYSSYWPKREVVLGNEIVRVLVADTYSHRLKGLSGRDGLGDSGGMLFVFPERGQHTMVMRDMLFSIDIVWIDGDSIVDMAPNLQPESGKKEADLTPYFARLPSTLVLELPAGSIARLGLKVGDNVRILE